MNVSTNSRVGLAIARLLANAYPNTPAGQDSHRADVITLRSMLRSSPDDTQRWRFIRERIPLTDLHAILGKNFQSPDRAYAAEVDETIDKARRKR